MRALFAILVVAIPASAAAQCLAASECVCQVAAATVLVGHISGISGGEATATIDSTVVVPDGGAAPTSVQFPSQASDSVGLQVIVGINPGSIPFRVDVQSDGNVSCPSLTPDKVPLATATAALKSSDCNAAIHAAGFKEPPCNDTGGCTSAGAGALIPVLLLLGLRALRGREAHRRSTRSSSR